MDLWSKGLGKLVLQMRLSERSEMAAEEGEVSLRGTMGAPVFWDYAVILKDEDVVDFLVFLQNPNVVRFLVKSGNRWQILRTTVSGALLFAGRIILQLFGVKPTRVAPTAVQATVPAAGSTAADILDQLPDDIAKDLQEAEKDG